MVSLALVSLLSSLCLARPAAAQDRPFNLRIAPPLALVIAQPAEPLARDAVLHDSRTEHENHVRLRTGRALRTAGIGLMVGGALGIFLSSGQHDFSRAGTATGATLAAIGTTLTIGGSLRVGRLDADTRRKSRSGWLYPLAVGVVLTSIGACVAASLPENGAFGH
jgi:hypothetical protein